MKKSYRIILNLVVVALFLLAFIIKAPNLNPLYPDGAFLWCGVITAFLAVNFLLGLGGIRLIRDYNGRAQLDFGGLKGFAKKALYIVAGIWALYFLVNVLSLPVFNFWAYRDQLGEPVQRAAFTQDIEPMDVDQLPIVDKELAYRLADKKLGERTSLGSQAMLGEPVIQKVNGRLVWAVPLHHSGFFKWLSNMSGTPGYILVSATDMQDVKYVDGHYIKYQPNSYFFDDLNRHIRVSGGAFDGLIDYSFEIDEEGNPKWVVTTYRNEWLFALPEATGVLVVDAETGDMQKYKIDELPDWVDRVQPEEIVMQQINNQGEYVHGIFNFSNFEKYKTSKGQIIVYNNDRCYLFTGLTSVGQDESAIGFILVDMVTKESNVYYMSGATESAAQSSAMGKVQQYKYQADFPMIINLDDVATYFMPLKDNAGLIKQYAFVSVEDFTKVGTGETISEARQNYNKQLREAEGNTLTEGSEVIQGTVLRIASEENGGVLIYKVILQERSGNIFLLPSDLSEELALTQPGDRVELHVQKGSKGVCSGFGFDNLEFTQK